jgi:hypothetical protein
VAALFAGVVFVVADFVAAALLPAVFGLTGAFTTGFFADEGCAGGAVCTGGFTTVLGD